MQGSAHTYALSLRNEEGHTHIPGPLARLPWGLCSVAGSTHTAWTPSPALSPCLTWAAVLALAAAPLSVNWG